MGGWSGCTVPNREEGLTEEDLLAMQCSLKMGFRSGFV
jgi:hypothetical protein